MAPILDLISAVAAVGTTAGVFVAGWQLWLTKRQAVTQFEDQLSGQYREIVGRLPVEVLLGDEVELSRELLSTFYQYFDLCNEQAFLFRRGRITQRTWAEWREGIEQNFRRPAFARSWEEVSGRAPDSFNELRTLVAARIALLRSSTS